MSEKFDPAAHMSKLKGKDYLEVKWRLVWFRQEHPDWVITTQLVEHDPEKGRALVRASVGAPDKDMILASGHKQETRAHFPDYLEKAETGAIGRALAALGYGTQFAPELEEGERIVDSPVPALPTRERDVQDNPDIIRSADDRDWKTWLRGLSKAQELGLNPKTMVLPQARADVVKHIKQVATDVRAREAELVA